MAKMRHKNGQDEAQDGQDEAQDGQDEAQDGQDEALGVIFFGGAPKSRYTVRDRPKMVVTFLSNGFWPNSEPRPRARQQQNGHFASTE